MPHFLTCTICRNLDNFTFKGMELFVVKIVYFLHFLIQCCTTNRSTTTLVYFTDLFNLHFFFLAESFVVL